MDSESSKIFQSLTTTDKLLIANAFDLYDDILEISLYLRYNNVNITNLNEIHCLLKKESEFEGYSTVVDYCQDKRYLKAICEYEKYKRLIYDVLENNVNFENFNIPEDETINVGKFYQIDIKNKDEAEIDDFITENLQTIEVNMGDQNLQIEPKNINNKIINKIRIESPKNVKDKKRFYIRMDDDEKVIDDYFDYLDMKNIEGNKDILNLGKDNKILKSFPLLVKGKVDLVEKKKLKLDKIEKVILVDKIPKEVKKERGHDLQSPFDILMHKIQTTKRQDKDKSMWKAELKIIADHLCPIFGKDGKFTNIYREMEGNSLQYSIMNMMLIIQDYIIDEEDDKILDDYCEYKRKLAAFCDYYKK